MAVARTAQLARTNSPVDHSSHTRCDRPSCRSSRSRGPNQRSIRSTVSPVYVQQRAQELAKKPFVSANDQVPERWAGFGYDQYRDVRFRAERAVWHGEHRNFELHLLPSGWLYKFPVAIYIVDGGTVKPIQPDSSMFAFGPLAGEPPADAPPDRPPSSGPTRMLV